MEDYLKAVFDLGENGVKTQALAESLEVSAASVTGMLKKLAALKLVVHEPYRGVSLTPTGRQVALETLRHHRLLETYLSQALGYAWHEVHEEAERLEHTISEHFEDRIAEALGHPTHDPHGDPIPRRDGSLPESPGLPLGTFSVGHRVVITRITDQQREVLEYLAERGLTPGERVVVREHEPLGGTLVLESHAGPVAVSLGLAAEIHAQVLPKEAGVA